MKNRVYIARKRVGSKTYYFIRQSYQDNACGLWRSRDLFALGQDPSRFIIYPGGHGFYLDETIEERLAAQGVKTDQIELEELFFPFLKPEIKRVIQDFARYSAPRSRRLPRGEQLTRQSSYHIFDRRRLVFLKFGQVNVDSLLKRPLVFLNVLAEKSRDEIEQMIETDEAILKPKEILAYIYASFGLSDYFAPRLTRFVPEAQGQEDMDRIFEEAFCRLANDEAYRMGLGREEVLRDYLSRYRIMYYDLGYRLRRQWVSFQRAQEEARRRHLAPEFRQACRRIGLREEEALRMDKAALLKYFRRLAKKHHPDRGGQHEEFIAIKKAVEFILVYKGYRRLS
ncbi:hypothetical protein [Thermosulfuriphilus sp.]